MDQKDAEIAALKAQLAAREGAPTGSEGAGAGDSRGEGVPGWLIVLGVLVFGGIGFVAWAQHEGDRINRQPLSERIAASCEREYGAQGDEAINACRVRLSLEAINSAETERLKRARSGV